MTEFHKKTSEALIVLRSNKIKSNQKAALNTNEKQVGIIWMFLRFAEYGLPEYVSICLTNFNNQKPANSCVKRSYIFREERKLSKTYLELSLI